MATLSAEAFWKLPKPERKVLIAKDILKLIARDKIIPQRTGYIDFSLDLNERGKSVRGNLKKMNNCTVCALGACMVAVADLGNKLSFNDLGNFYHYGIGPGRNLLEKCFTRREMGLIEACFENGRSPFTDDELNSEDYNTCQEFYSVYDTPKDILKAIAKNIIRNKGRFIPSQDIKGKKKKD